jgi:hypothetical protein
MEVTTARMEEKISPALSVLITPILRKHPAARTTKFPLTNAMYPLNLMIPRTYEAALTNIFFEDIKRKNSDSKRCVSANIVNQK